MLRKYKVLLLNFDEILGFALLDWLNSIEDINASFGAIGEKAATITDPDRAPNIIILFEPDNNTSVEMNNLAGEIPIIKIGGRAKNTDETEVILINLPLRFKSLEAKIRQTLRMQADKQMAALKIGDFSFSPNKKALIFGKQELKLTEKEISILTYLNQVFGASVGREELLREVWRYNEGVSTHTLETHIYRLRQKLAQIFSNREILITTEGGYRLQT